MLLTNRWIAGCAALLIGAAAPALAAPPQPQETGDKRIDTEQIFENAKDRAAEERSETSRNKQDQSDQAATAQDTDPEANGTDAGDEALRAERRDQAAGRKLAKDESQAGRLPEGFDRLGLTDREQAAMLRVIAQYDRQTEDLLNRFGRLHAQAIGIEAVALAESARRNGGSVLTAQNKDGHAPQGRQSEQGQQAGRRTAGFRAGDAAHEHGTADAADKPAQEIEALAQSSPFAGPSADIWKKLHELHLEAVKVEAQKLAAIEKLLSPEQLAQLHRFREESRLKQGGSQAAGTDRPDRPDLQNAAPNPEEERRDSGDD